jgi:hypothetical protein
VNLAFFVSVEALLPAARPAKGRRTNRPVARLPADAVVIRRNFGWTIVLLVYLVLIGVRSTCSSRTLRNCRKRNGNSTNSEMARRE